MSFLRSQTLKQQESEVTALRYDNRTEASSRYEKLIDPERCDQALALSMKYFKELYPEMKVTGYCDKYVKKLDRAEIDVNLLWLEEETWKASDK